MKLATMIELLWGSRARFIYLLTFALFLLFTLLGGRELWTQEHRWADIVAGMLYHQDYFHPYLDGKPYYDKPLLSYWLIILAAKLSGFFNVWSLRLPSALAGVLAIWSIYSIGKTLKNKEFGLLSGWMLLTTFFFLFWARTASADMLNLAGSLCAIAWYMAKRQQGNWFNYSVFFLIIALTSLCKGLVGAIVPLIAVFADLILSRSIKQHMRLSMVIAAILAFAFYLLPFIASSYIGGNQYSQNGLYLVYKENILRYFQPFDHRDPIYTYLIYLPIYLLPWTFFFIPALVSMVRRWQTLSYYSRWVALTLFFLFLFFTVSGSRRSYYVLPLVPFAILLTADWVLSDHTKNSKKSLWAGFMVLLGGFVIFITIHLFPSWYYYQYGVERFAVHLKEEANKLALWDSWQVVMLDAESKLAFYLHLPPETPHYGLLGERNQQTTQTLLKAWPILATHPPQTIFITRKSYAPLLEPLLPHYKLLDVTPHSKFAILQNEESSYPVAFIPKTL